MLTEKLKEIGPPCFDKSCIINGQRVVDKYIEDVSNAMHQAAKEAGFTPAKVFPPKPYWCPELAYIRDRKKFWFHVWTQAGKPRDCQLYECYKGIKKLFRRVTRQCCNNIQSIGFSKINSYFYHNNMNNFWRRIKKVRNKKVNSNLEPGKFSEYYQRVMKGDLVLSREQDQFKDQIVEEFKLLSEHANTKLEPAFVSKLIYGLNNNSAPGIDDITAEHLLHGKSDVLFTYLGKF